MARQVALVKGGDRRANIRRALTLIERDIDLDNKTRILIKPNFVSVDRQLAATHVDAVRAVLDYLTERGAGAVTIGEGPAFAPAEIGYRNFGYLKLLDEYDVRLVDLNEQDTEVVQGFDSELKPIRLRVSREVVHADFRISITPPKTHDCVIVTAGIKNMAVGSLISDFARRTDARAQSRRKAVSLAPHWLKTWKPLEPFRSRYRQSIAKSSDKAAVHQGSHGINLNLYLLARHTAPHLSIIDGTVGMEGSGPEGGDPVPMGIAIASCDAVAADCLMAYLMGFRSEEIGYLSYCVSKGMGIGDVSKMKILGDDTERCKRKFDPHPNYASMLNWRHPGVDAILAADDIAPITWR